MDSDVLQGRQRQTPTVRSFDASDTEFRNSLTVIDSSRVFDDSAKPPEYFHLFCCDNVPTACREASRCGCGEGAGVVPTDSHET